MADKVKVYGKAQNRTALGIVHAYLTLHPEATLEDLRKAFPGEIHTKTYNKQYLHLFYPKGGVIHDCGPKEGEELDAKALDLDFFDEEDELIDLADGSRIYFQKFWNETDYLRMVEKAKEYEITVEEFEKTEKSFEKGNYRLEYINGYVPPVVEHKPKTTKDGNVRFATPFMDAGNYAADGGKGECSCCCWLKKILALLALLLILLLLFLLIRGCNTKTSDRQANLCGCCGEDRDLNTKTSNDDKAAALADAADKAAADKAKAEADSIEAAKEAARKAAQEELDALHSQFAAIRFKEVGSAALNNNSKKELDAIAELLNKYPDFKIKIIGHASQDGTDEANQRVSENRANAAKDYLVQKGVSPDRIMTEGRGAREPISTTDQALNRRTEFEIVK